MTNSSKSLQEIQVTITITRDELKYLANHVARAQMVDAVQFAQFSIIDSICADIVEAAIKQVKRG